MAKSKSSQQEIKEDKVSEIKASKPKKEKVDKNFIQVEVITENDFEKITSIEELQKIGEDYIETTEIKKHKPDVDIFNDPYVGLSRLVSEIVSRTNVVNNEYGEAWIVLSVEDNKLIDDFLTKRNLRNGLKMIVFVLNRRVYDYLSIIARLNRLPILFIYYSENANYWKLDNNGELLVIEQIAKKVNLHLFIFLENNIADHRLLNSLGSNFRYKPFQLTEVLREGRNVTSIETNLISVLKLINPFLVDEYLTYIDMANRETNYEVKRVLFANTQRVLNKLRDEFTNYAYYHQNKLLFNPYFRVIGMNLRSFIERNSYLIQ